MQKIPPKVEYPTFVSCEFRELKTTTTTTTWKTNKKICIHILASTAPWKLEGYYKNTSSGFVLKDHKKVLSAHKNVKYSLTHLPLLSSAAPHLSSTLPVRTGSGNTRRKSFPGLESAGEIRAVQAHQRASGTISRWENRRALSLTAHVGKRNRGHAGLCAADLHALVLTLKMCHESRKKCREITGQNFPTTCCLFCFF